VKLPGPLQNGFSPYRDPEPWAEFYDDLAQRGATAFAFAIAVHIGLFLILQPSFRMPDIPIEPESIPVQIVAFEPAPPAHETEPEPVILYQALPAAPAPKPKPTCYTKPKMPKCYVAPKPKPSTGCAPTGCVYSYRNSHKRYDEWGRRVQ